MHRVNGWLILAALPNPNQATKLTAPTNIRKARQK